MLEASWFSITITTMWSAGFAGGDGDEPLPLRPEPPTLAGAHAESEANTRTAVTIGRRMAMRWAS